MSSGASAPPAPDYSPVAQSSLEAAKMQQETSAEQLDWAKEQYADQAPRTMAYMDAMTGQMQQQSENAGRDRDRYESMYQPTEDKFVEKANNWNSADRQTQQAGMALADVNRTFEAARRNSTASLESFGIDPSQTRYGALDLGTRVSQAAAQASAGTTSRLNTEATGLALQGEAINIGKGYPGQVAQSYSGATTAGGAGITSGLNTSSTYGNMMGTAAQWSGLSTNSNQAAMGALKAGGDYGLQTTQMANQASAASSAGIGSLVGAGISAAAIIAV